MNEISGNQILERLGQIFAEYDSMADQLDQIRVIVNAPGAVYDDRLAGDIRAALDGPTR